MDDSYLKKGSDDPERESDEAIRVRYISILKPLFLPDEPTDPDIIQLFASLLRVVGMEDKAFVIGLEELDDLLRRAKIFIGTFFGLEREARRAFGAMAGGVKAYDPHYKGIMEVLTDGEGLMNGFKVHWPNGSDSFYRRTADGIDMCNCMLGFERKTIDLFVGQYARVADPFSPLVELGAAPIYTPADGSDISLVWAP